jgi:hypothetical protein
LNVKGSCRALVPRQAVSGFQEKAAPSDADGQEFASIITCAGRIWLRPRQREFEGMPLNPARDRALANLGAGTIQV